jgi:hypothetical protein
MPSRRIGLWKLTNCGIGGRASYWGEEVGMEMSYIDNDGGGGGVVDEILSNDDA